MPKLNRDLPSNWCATDMSSKELMTHFSSHTFDKVLAKPISKKYDLKVSEQKKRIITQGTKNATPIKLSRDSPSNWCAMMCQTSYK